MKKFIGLFCVLLFFLLLLCFPSQTFTGASKGLLLWYRTVLPTLLPFIFCSNLLISTHAISYISKFCAPLLQKIFGVSKPATYAILVGFLCGYPLGAKAINDLLKENYITLKEGKYLLSFCNNASPMFIISFLVIQLLKDTRYTLGTLSVLLLSPILCSIFFRFFYRIPAKSLPKNRKETPTFYFDFNLLDDCIINALETIVKIGGYIILFSILTCFLENSPFYYIAPSLEISNGVSTIVNWSLPFPFLYIVILSLTSFGGFCAIAQTGAMLKESKLPLLPYIIEKLITTLVTSFLAYVYIYFIHQ